MSEPNARREIAAAIEGAAEAAAGPAAEQLDWLPPLRDALTGERRAAIADAVRRRGRPAGAQNIAKREALDFIRRVFGDPLIERSRWLLLSPAELASAIGCTTAEAFDRQDAIRADLARFFYAHLAPVDAAGNVVVPRFSMQIGGAVAPGADALPPWERHRLEMLEKPAKSMDLDAVSHEAVSHEVPK